MPLLSFQMLGAALPLAIAPSGLGEFTLDRDFDAAFEGAGGDVGVEFGVEADAKFEGDFFDFYIGEGGSANVFHQVLGVGFDQVAHSLGGGRLSGSGLAV